MASNLTVPFALLIFGGAKMSKTSFGKRVVLSLMRFYDADDDNDSRKEDR